MPTSDHERDGVGVNRRVPCLTKLQHGISGVKLNLMVALSVHELALVDEFAGYVILRLDH